MLWLRYIWHQQTTKENILEIFGQRSKYLSIKFPLHKPSEKRGNYSREEIIQGRKLFAEIRQLLTLCNCYSTLQNTVKRSPKFVQIGKFGLCKKAAVVSYFCLTRNTHHNVLIPRIIEIGHKTFMLIQTLVLNTVHLFQKRDHKLLIYKNSYCNHCIKV